MNTHTPHPDPVRTADLSTAVYTHTLTHTLTVMYTHTHTHTSPVREITSEAHRRSCLCSPSPVALLSVTEDEDAAEEDCVRPLGFGTGSRCCAQARLSRESSCQSLHARSGAEATAESRVWWCLLMLERASDPGSFRAPLTGAAASSAAIRHTGVTSPQVSCDAL